MNFSGITKWIGIATLLTWLFTLAVIAVQPFCGTVIKTNFLFPICDQDTGLSGGLFFLSCVLFTITLSILYVVLRVIHYFVSK